MLKYWHDCSSDPKRPGLVIHFSQEYIPMIGQMPADMARSLCQHRMESGRRC